MGIDVFVQQWIQNIRVPAVDTFFISFTHLGDWPFLFVLVAVISMLLCRFHHRRQALTLFVNVWGGGLIVLLIKYSVQRLRPEFGLVEEVGFSFPSAHAFLSFSFYGCLLYLLWKTRMGNIWKCVGTLCLGTMIVLISFSRIYLGVHWLSDVVGGLVLAGIWIRVVGRWVRG